MAHPNNSFGRDKYKSRQTKRYFRKNGGDDKTYEAFLYGQIGLKRNYPPGMRHDYYLKGLNEYRYDPEEGEE